MCRGDRELRAVLERAVLDELGVYTAIAGVVNILESGSVSGKTQRLVVRLRGSPHAGNRIRMGVRTCRSHCLPKIERGHQQQLQK